MWGREQREEGTGRGVPLPVARCLLRWRRPRLLTLGRFQVEPFASLAEAVRSSVPRVFINQEAAGSLAWRPRSKDVLQLGDLVDGVQRLVALLGWTEELKDLVQRETEQVPAGGATLAVRPGPAGDGQVPAGGTDMAVRPGQLPERLRMEVWCLTPRVGPPGSSPREAGTQGPLSPEISSVGSSRLRREAE